jgi:hypothetical protein
MCSRFILGAAPIAAGVVLGGCTGEAPAREGRTGSAAEPARAAEVRLGWGSGLDQVGLTRRIDERAAEGPSAVAVGSGGAIFVLDRLNERVIEVAPGGGARVVAPVPRDAEHLAAGPDGAVAAWSPLRAAVWLRGADGAAAGELAVPRALRDVEALSLHASRRVRVTTALQETLDLGSPAAPLDLPAVLRTGREGAAFLPDGRGVAARRTAEGGGEILVYGRAEHRKPQVAHAHPVEGPVASIRIVGAVAGAVCVRIERASAAPQVEVAREARCVDPDTGGELLRADLPAPGLYTPHRDLAVGGRVLAFVHPGEDGLLVRRWPIPAGAEVAR